MKHRFLLDENVLHHAIKGVDAHDNPDLTSAQLVLLIAQNCHRITLTEFLRGRYTALLRGLERVRSGVLQPAFFLVQLIHNSAKQAWEYDQPPRLPEGCQIPAEDVEVVRAALASRPLFVTSDAELRLAINACEALRLRAMSPAEAIPFAQDS